MKTEARRTEMRPSIRRPGRGKACDVSFELATALPPAFAARDEDDLI